VCAKEISGPIGNAPVRAGLLESTRRKLTSEERDLLLACAAA
jgi:hypothetical protein